MHGNTVFHVGSLGVFVAVLGFVGLVALVVFAAVWAKRARRRGLMEFAQRNGFAYQFRPGAENPPAIDLHERVFATDAGRTFLRQFSGCPLFDSGSWRDVKNVITGRKNGHEWTIFDYSHWTEARGQAESEVVQVTCAVLDTGRSLGRFSVEPRLPVLGVPMAALGRGDVIQTGDAEFDSRFIVRSPCAQDTVGVLVPSLRAFLLGLYRDRNRYYRQLYVHDGLIIISECCAPARHLPAMMEIALEFHRLFGKA